MKLRYTAPGQAAVTLEGVKLSRFSVENLYEGESFNRSGRKQTVEGTAYITGNPLTSGTGAVDVIRNRLNTPRGKLELQFDDNASVWYELADGSNSSTTSIRDSRNGPLPTVSITDVHGGNTAAVTIVSFSYTFFGCGGTRIQRFEMSVSQSIDEAGFITMTRSGTLCISAAGTNAAGSPAVVSNPEVIPTVPPNGTVSPDPGNSPDLYRNLVAGKPADGFRRTKQDYAVDSSLRNLSFTIEDQMVFRELKYPVMMGDASFTYERSLDNPLGSKNFSATFEGEPSTHPSLILKVAVEAASARIDFENDLIQSITVKEPSIYGRNKIELSIVALGQSEETLDPSLIRDMFADPHKDGTTKYVKAYPNNGVFVDEVTGFIFDPCQLPDYVREVVTVNPDDTDSGKTIQSTLEVSDAELITSNGSSVTTPLATDPFIENINNAIKHLETETIYDHVDSGLDYLETCGGIVQFPFQTRLPTVVVRQTVRMVATSQNVPIPWENLNEDGVVLSQQIAVKSTSVDASGKATYAIVAVRAVRIKTSTSLNTQRLVGSDSSGSATDRRVYAPSQVAAPRSLYASNTDYTSTGNYANQTGILDYLIRRT